MVSKSILGIIIIELLSCNSIYAAPLSNETSSGLNVVIIGAGPSGLVSTKYAIEQGFDVTVYEQGEELGGQWVYTDNVGKDKYGNSIYSAMYKNLRTNSPIQNMEFKDHHYSSNITTSYPGSKDILIYLQSYADRFDLKKHIKFNHLVVRVHPIENGKWEVIVKDQPNNKFQTKIFDVVFVCNGRYSLPHQPKIEGVDRFKGEIIHSHDFRTADKFRGEKVLVIGGGTSGTDLVGLLSNVASHISLSVRKPTNQANEEQSRRDLPKMVKLKHNVKHFTANGAVFIDGTYQNFTRVIYATGYNFSYPFLSNDSRIHVDDNFAQPLYKQIFNINHPTMAFISVPRAVFSLPLYDLQARFTLKFISGAKKLPSKADMLTDIWTQSKDFWELTFLERLTKVREYFETLSETANIENIPDVLLNMELDSYLESLSNPFGYRNCKYTIIDEKKFKKVQVN